MNVLLALKVPLPEETEDESLPGDSLSFPTSQASQNAPISEDAGSVGRILTCSEASLLPLTKPSSPSSSHIRILYCRATSMRFSYDEEDAEEVPPRTAPFPAHRVQTPLTQVKEYRLFMETSITVKLMLIQLHKNILQALSHLQGHIPITNDPGFGDVEEVQAWIWIVEEALTLTTRNLDTSATNWSFYVGESLADLLSTFTEFWKRVETIFKDYKTLLRRFNKVYAKVSNKLSWNQEAGRESWKGSGEEEKLEECLGLSVEGSYQEVIKRGHLNLNKGPYLTRVLKTRWSVDGITVSLNVDHWCKLLSFETFYDKEKVIDGFFKGLKGPVRKGTGYLLVATELLKRKELGSFKRLFGTLSEALEMEEGGGLVPKEQVQMTSVMLTNNRILERTSQGVWELWKRGSDYFNLVKKLVSRKGEILKGRGRRVPMDRWAEFCLEVNYVTPQLDIIFERNSTPKRTFDKTEAPGLILDTRTGKEMKTTISPTESYEKVVVERDEVLKAKSTMESLVVGDICIFPDFRPEYSAALITLLKSHNLEPASVKLCNDKVRSLYQTLQEMNKPLEDTNDRINRARDTLTSANRVEERSGRVTGSGDKAPLPGHLHWFQIIIRSLRIWDTKDLPQYFRYHFAQTNQTLVDKSVALTKSMGSLVHLLTLKREALGLLQEAIRVIPGIHTLEDHQLKWKLTRREELKTLEPEVGQPSASFTESVSIKFSDFDMELEVKSSAASDPVSKIVLNGSPGQIQVSLMTPPFLHLIRVIDSLLVRITWSHLKLGEMLDLKSIGDSLLPPLTLDIPPYHLLEAGVIVHLLTKLELHLETLTESITQLDSEVTLFVMLVGLIPPHVSAKRLSFDKVRTEGQMKLIEEVVNDIPTVFPVTEPAVKWEYKRLIKAQRQVAEVEVMKRRPFVVKRSVDPEPVEINQMEEVVQPKEVVPASVLPVSREFDPIFLKTLENARTTLSPLLTQTYFTLGQTQFPAENCEGDVGPVIGTLTLLVRSVLNLQFFKEITKESRDQLSEKLKRTSDHFNSFGNSKGSKILTEIDKTLTAILKRIHSLQEEIRKVCKEREQNRVQEHGNGDSHDISTENPHSDNPEASTEYNTKASTDDSSQASTEYNTIAAIQEHLNSSTEESDPSTEDNPEASTEDNPKASTEDNPEVSTEDSLKASTEDNSDPSTENDPEVSTEDNPEASTEDPSKGQLTLAYHLAVKMSRYVWSAVCGRNEGIILKNMLTLESHPYLCLPLWKRMEVVHSVLAYLDQLLGIANTNLVQVKKELKTVKRLLKSLKLTNLKKGYYSNTEGPLDVLANLERSVLRSMGSRDELSSLFGSTSGMVKTLVRYLDLKFHLPGGSSDLKVINRRLWELEIGLKEMVRLPVQLYIPLSFPLTPEEPHHQDQDDQHI